MPSLLLLRVPTKDPPPPEFARGRVFNLPGHDLIIGREPDKALIVLPHKSVSKIHAGISVKAGQYFIEDLGSRNKTFVNNHRLKPGVSVQLNPNDWIDICDFRLQFCDDLQDSGATSTVELSHGTVEFRDYIEAASSDRLRTLAEVSNTLARTLQPESVLNLIADSLFGVFPQADRCFVLVLDEDGELVPRVMRGRKPDADDLRYSKTIVTRATQEMQSFLSEDASNEVPADSVLSILIRSVMCVPMATINGEPLGAIQLDTQLKSQKFGPDDLNLLTVVANMAGAALEKARLHAVMVEVEAERGEIRTARKVQLSLLPLAVPQRAGYEFYSFYAPAQTVGGDYYDFVPLPGGRLGIVLGDVAGHGVPAALLMAKLSSEAKFSLVTQPDLATAVATLNDQMIHGALAELPGRFITLTVMVLDPEKHQLTMVSAGHESPRLFSRAKSKLEDIMSIEAIGFAIGLMEGYSEYEAVTITLEPGDTVIAYTDGVPDALNAAQKFLGRNKIDLCLKSNLASATTTQPVTMGERLVDAVRKHTGEAPQNDDIAIVCFGRLLPGETPRGISTTP